MEKKISLAFEISKIQALLLSGESTHRVRRDFEAWLLPYSAVRAVGREKLLVDRGLKILDVLKTAERLGASLVPALKELKRFIREEERLLERLVGVERQFALQAAIGVVLPWFVAVASFGLRWNILFGLALASQAVGIFIFYYIIKRVMSDRDLERQFLFNLIMDVWLSCSAGVHLHAALAEALKRPQLYREPFSDWWQSWLHHIVTDTRHDSQHQWSVEASYSPEVGQLLRRILSSGVGVQTILIDWLDNASDDRLFEVQNRLNQLPTLVSLVFCVCFAPAMFLVLFGSVYQEVMAVL